MAAETRLRYNHPAAEWMDGLPIGTGRLAAMVLGTTPRERIALNHEWLWRGTNRDRENRTVADRLSTVRDLLLAGNYAQGTEEANRAFACHAETRVPNRVDPYQPAGDLWLDVGHACTFDYRRELDLTTGIASIIFRSMDTGRPFFRRDVVAHLGLDVILVRLTALSEPGGAPVPFDCRISLDRRIDPHCDTTRTATDTTICLNGTFTQGVSFQVAARVLARGKETGIKCDAGCIAVVGAHEIIVGVDAGTSVSGDQTCERLEQIDGLNWEETLETHCAEFARHGGNFQMDLPLPTTDDCTDRRMEELRRGIPDPGLALLYYHFGRYLLIASSANGSLPANLQGKWNEDIEPPWNCDYHHDVNLQMNYWPAENGGMQGSVDALLQHIERFADHARSAARDLYGCRGLWYPIQTDAWGRATPESFGWAVWVGAAPWLAQHMWWHYEYDLNEDFLRQRAYPFMKEVAAFFEDYLIEDDTGALLCVPSQSPENRFRGGGEDRFPVSLCVNAAMDLELIWDLLTHLVNASHVLKVDHSQRGIWEDMLRKLPTPGIGPDGRLLEWNEPFEETEPGHRHLSHLYGLFPGEQFCPFRTPDLFKAAERSLEGRMAASGGHTGWSRAWVACLYARLGRGDDAFEHLQHLITDFASNSLLDLHPPKIFQIEGNLGGVTAIHEMLLQSYYGEIHFLPALPSAWPQGTVSGLRARHGFDVGINWAEGRLIEARILSRAGAEAKIVDPDRELTVLDAEGRELDTEQCGWLQCLRTKPGDILRVVRRT